MQILLSVKLYIQKLFELLTWYLESESSLEGGNKSEDNPQQLFILMCL